MANIIKRFARHRDDMRLENFQRVRSLNAERKLLRCPSEYRLPNLTPLWANRNLGANRSDVVSGRIFKRDVNVAVCFHFCVNDAASESTLTAVLKGDYLIPPQQATVPAAKFPPRRD